MRKLFLIILSVLTYATTYAQNITSIAGGFGDGIPAINTPIYGPDATALDAAGNIYFAVDSRIRKVNVSTGIISTVAGNGTWDSGGDGGAATLTGLAGPSGIAVDASGNIYIAEYYNHRIRKVTASTGIISTVAGNGTPAFGGDDSAATSAKLNNPSGVAVDGAGNIYIADNGNRRIRKVTASTGIISTVAGNGIITYGSGGDGGAATSASLMRPKGVALDASGNIYIADYNNHRIRKVTVSTGIISTVAGVAGSFNGGYGGDGGAATSADLKSPNAIAIDGLGNIYIADADNNRIRKVTASTGIISTVAGNGTGAYGSRGDGGAATSANIYYPLGVALDASGNIYIADNSNYSIRKVTTSTGIISTVAGNGTQYYGGDGSVATSASLYNPSGVTLDGSGNIYIADVGNNRIRKITASTGIINTIAGNGTGFYGGDGSAATSAILNSPSKIAVDALGNIYIADAGNNRIRKVTASTGIISTVAGNGIRAYAGDGSGATTGGCLNNPSGVAVDASGNIYIADAGNNSIRKVTALTGIISTVAGNGTAAYGGDGSAATSANLSSPTDVALDGSGNIYIADQGNHRIRKVTTSTGIISTIAGNGTVGYMGDGSAATSARLNYPSGVSVDGSGNIYIADYVNNRIRKVTATTGIISTVAGNGTGSYGGDGSTATSASIYYPFGVAADGSGNIYIADARNNRIRKVRIAIGNNIISNSQTICAGSAPTILTGSTPISDTSSFTYSWLSSTTSATAGFSAIPSTNTINYSPGVLTQNTWFRRYVVSGALTDTSAAIAITVNTIPTAPSTPTRVSKTATSINVTWGAVSGAIGYKLDVSTNSGFTALVSGYSNTSVTGTSTTITGLTGSTTYYVRVRAVNATLCNSVSSSVLTETTPASTVSLTLRAYLQGLYAGGKMISAPFNADGTSPQNIADTITVELRANTTPYNVIHTVKGLLDTSGNATITFPGSVNGNSYYVVIGHRNSVAVWSANPVAFSTNTNYDFTNAATKAFGSNMVQAGGVFMLFSGDINQDGSIDFADYPDFEISSGNSDLGYLPYDLNGDASVDFADYPLIDINSSNGVIILTP